MEVFSSQFMSALLAIIVIDLVLAGDNAIVIGLAARNLPKELQRKAVLRGAVGAVVVRALLTLVVVWLLKIPGFLLAGGLALLWIAYQLVAEDNSGGHDGIASGTTFRQAIQTIIVADTVMGVDNVLAVAGAAHGSFLLVVIGLLVSIPIVMLGSTMILKWVEKYPSIITVGAGVLGWTAAKMLTSEPLFKTFFTEHRFWRITLFVFCVGIIVAIPMLKKLKGRISVLAVALPFAIFWLVMFGYLEDFVDRTYFPDGNAPVVVDIIDLVMWLGWIPIVVAIDRALRPATTIGITARD